MKRALGSGVSASRFKYDSSKNLDTQELLKKTILDLKILSGSNRNMYVIGRDVADDTTTGRWQPEEIQLSCQSQPHRAKPSTAGGLRMGGHWGTGLDACLPGY